MLLSAPVLTMSVEIGSGRRDVYVGNGCFWALQHLVVTEFENEGTITAATGCKSFLFLSFHIMTFSIMMRALTLTYQLM